MEELIGKKLENYKIISILGKGGMGVVYKAYDTKLERYVAVKMLSSQFFAKERFVERFKREAKNQAKLSHPNIVTVYGFIEYRGYLGIVMEYIEGESLEKLIHRQGRVHLYDALYVMKQVLAGIGYAHSKGFIHRDIKPSNIIFNAEGVAKIMDFGISKSLLDEGFTKTGAKVGTIYYMSPEQIRGGQITHHSDIYSLGCTFYEMITGKPPFDADSEYEVMDSHLHSPPPKLSKALYGIPVQFDAIIEKALNKNPNERHDNCEEFLTELREIDNYIAELQERLSARSKPNKKKNKIFSIAGFSVFLLLMLALSWFAYTQVDSLLKNRGLDNLKKYNIETLFESNDDTGITLSQFSLIETGVDEQLNSIHFANNNDGIAAGDSGTVILTDDGGKNWRAINLNTKTSFYDCYLSNEGIGIIVAQNGSVYYTQNYFINFEIINLSNGNPLFKVDFPDINTGFIVGGNGLIFKTEDKGKSWAPVESRTNELLYDIHFISGSTGYAAGWNGVYLKTTDSGDNWLKMETFSDKYIRDLEFVDEKLGIAVGGGSQIYKTDNGGDSWFEITVSRIGGFQAVKFITNKLVIIPGNRGELLVSKNQGSDWTLMDTRTYLNFTSIANTSNGNIYLAGVNGNILLIQ